MGSAGFSAFEKIKCIFSIAPVGNLEKSRECKHSPHALRGGTGRWPLAFGVLSGVAECTGRTGVSPMLSVWCAGGLATLSAHESGEHRTLRVRPVTVRVCEALYARVRCAPDASGVSQ